MALNESGCTTTSRVQYPNNGSNPLLRQGLSQRLIWPKQAQRYFRGSKTPLLGAGFFCGLLRGRPSNTSPKSTSPDVSCIAVARPWRWLCHWATRPAVPRNWFRGVLAQYVAGSACPEPVEGTPEDARKDGHIRGRSHAGA